MMEQQASPVMAQGVKMLVEKVATPTVAELGSAVASKSGLPGWKQRPAAEMRRPAGHRFQVLLPEEVPLGLLVSQQLPLVPQCLMEHLA